MQSFAEWREKMFDIQVVNGEITVGAEALALFKEARRLEASVKRNEVKLAQFKEELMKAMKESGVKSFDTDVVKAVYVPEHTSERLDTKSLKAEHPKIAAKYMKESTVKESLRLSYK